MTDIFVAPEKESPKEKTHSILNDPNNINFLSSFCQNPQGVSFETQKPEESIILFLRSHFLTNLSWIAISIVLISLPAIAGVILPNMHISFLTQETASRFITVFALFYYLIVFSYIFLSFLSWFYNVFIVTTERILDIDYSDVVVHNMAETKLNHIEDVRYAQSGFIPSFVNYGNLFIQTAGTERNFEALSVPKPREATNITTELIEKK